MADFQSVANAVSGIGLPGVSFGAGFKESIYIDATDIDRLAADIRSFRKPITESLYNVIIPSIAANFDSEGRPNWAPLSENTIRIRGENGPILKRTGRLRGAATQKNMWNIMATELNFRATYFGGKVPYGVFHQVGTRFMPARSFVMLQPQDEVAIYAIFIHWLGDRVDAYWGRFE